MCCYLVPAVWLAFFVCTCAVSVIYTSTNFESEKAYDLMHMYSKPRGGGGVLPYKRLMGMCRWVGLHFHDWIDYNGIAFSIE